MIKLNGVSKTYIANGKSFKALSDINLEFPSSGFICILGESGCGKTTLLNLIGGLDHNFDGEIFIDNNSTKNFKDVDWDNYRNKKIGFVFQTYNLLPNLTVLENVTLSLALSGISIKEREERALNVLKEIGIENIAKKKANLISGGQAQRVAIARAIVNNPEIILADEPTGALDSTNSEQILDILKKISKTRLVLMVTHAQVFAKQYASRIINLKDGKIISDTDISKEKNNQVNKINSLDKKIKMPVFSLIKTSWKNFINKKKRSIIITVTTSVGIMGVALTLGLTNGLKNYVNEVETSAATTVPITVTPFVSSTKTLIPSGYEPWPSEKHIIPYDDESGGKDIHHNVITKDYFNYASKLVDQGYAASVLENHEGLDFNILTKKGLNDNSDVFKVNQFASGGEIGTISSTYTNVPASIFHELYGDENYITSLYDVIEGRYPKNKNEVVLACDRYNRIPIQTLKNLGIINDNKTDYVNFSDIVNKKTYKIYSPDKLFTTTNPGNAPYETKIDKTKYWKLPKKDEASLTDLLTLQEADEDKIIQSYDNITNVTNPDGQKTLNEFYDNSSSSDCLEVKVVGIIRLKRTTQVSLIPGSICYTKDLKNYYLDLIKNSQFEKYRNAARYNWYIPRTGNDSLDKEKWKQMVQIAGSAILNKDKSTLTSLMNSSLFSFYDVFTSDNISHNAKMFDINTGFNSYLSNNLRFSTEFSNKLELIYKSDVPYIKGYDDLMDISSYLSGYSTITSILIFPKNLVSKTYIRNYLDKYNDGKTEINQIKYSDLAGSLTTTISSLVQTVTVSLIMFSAVALIVSGILIGVISYTSVIERTKEIGLLRAVGARKRDVSMLFEFESMMMGAIGSIIGIVIIYIIEIPISNLLLKLIPGELGQMCNLNPLHALLLLLAAIAMSFISGFFPARIAAKKDPVEALREN